MIFLMRRLLLFALVGSLAGLAACAPKAVPVPVVTAPTFPEFTRPPVPLALAGSPAIPGHERGWRFFQAGDLRNAEREIAATIKLVPGFHPAEAAGGYLNLARKDPKAALGHFDRALELQGNYLSALVGRGQALVALGREGEAIAAFGAALAVDPSLTDLQRRIEVLRFRGLERDLAAARAAARTDRPEEARRAYQAAIASPPDSAFLYRELDAVERRAGASEPALAYFRKAAELDPSDASSWALIGELLEARGDQQGAMAAYNEALTLEPSETVEARRDALIARAELAKLPEEYRAIDTASQITRGDLAALIGVRLSDLVQAMRSREALVVTDVRPHWAEPWIMAVGRAGIIEAYANHTFQPRTLVGRADLAQAANRLLSRIGTPAQIATWQNARAKFSDIGAGHLAYPAASAAVTSGVMTAAADGSFQPSRLVTGAEAIETARRLRAMADRTAGRAGGR
jgi:tetratricopeptide (TPR) repeat protein